MERKFEAQVQSKLSGKMLCLGVLIGVIIGIVAFAPVWLQHNGQYMEYGDYFLQYVPFIKELKRMVMSGSLSWSWNSFLGDSFIGAYSYYTVFNPFAWFVAFFPDNYILYGTMLATLLKLAVSMLAAMLYMRRFCKKDIYALIGALLYTFSGFTLVATNYYFFLDVVAIFPFVLYGLEKLIFEKKRTAYVLSLMLNAAINYYFFVSTVFLVIIYVVFRLELYKPSSWKAQWKTFCRIAVYSIVGTGLAGIALIPSFYAILGSGKATGTIGTKLLLMYWPQNILERFRTLVAPIESGRYHAFFDGSTWSSSAVYLPVFGSSLVLQWCVQRKDWLKKICIVLLVCYFVPFLNAIFNLFSSTDYTRWLYGMALIFALVTVLTLEENERLKKTINKKLLAGVTLSTFALLLVPTIVYFLHKYGISIVNRFASACVTEYFMGYSALVIMLILTAANYVALWAIATTRRITAKCISWIILVACILNFGVYNAINYDLHATDYSNNYYYQKGIVQGDVRKYTVFDYRVDYSGNDLLLNYGLFKNIPSVKYYNSIQNYNSTRFAEAVGIVESTEDVIFGSPSTGTEFVDALLSVKYYYDYDGNSVVPTGFHYLKSENGVDIYENENYIPMGFIYDSYCLEDQLTDMLPEERAKLMLKTMVISKPDEEIVSEYLPLASDVMDDAELTRLIHDRKKTVCSSFSGTSDGFTAEINLEKDNIVFFSIPNDIGWEITVNGKPAHTVEANYGLLGICCTAGDNTISATYHTQGWLLGVVCSVYCLTAWLLLEMFNKRTNYEEAK